MLPKTMLWTLTAVPQSDGDVVHAAVVDGARVIPGAEDGLDGLQELNLRVLGNSTPIFSFVDLLEADDDFLHVLGIQVGVVLSALAPP